MENNIFVPPDSVDEEVGPLSCRNSRDAVGRSSMPPPSQDGDEEGPNDSFRAEDMAGAKSLQPQSPSWQPNCMPMSSNREEEEEDDIIGGDDRMRSGRDNEDRRKLVNLATPTLVDEDDGYYEEEEMITLEQERLMRTSQVGGDYEPELLNDKDDTSHLRRTPGANMYASSFDQTNSPVRRTPGASAMHRSAVEHPNVATQVPVGVAASDDSVLKFGLNLTTPVVDRCIEEEETPSSSTSSPPKKLLSESRKAEERIKENHLLSIGESNNAIAHQQQQERNIHSYTPAGWTLSRNPNLDVVHGAFSPNTFRLTQTLDNLLLDDDEGSWGPYDESKTINRCSGDTNNNDIQSDSSLPQIFKDANMGEDFCSRESWTESFIIGNSNNDKGSRSRMQKFTSGRIRRNRRDMKRNRTTGSSAIKFDPPKTGDNPVQTQYPKPLRQPHGASILPIDFLRGTDPSEVAQDQNYPSDEEISPPQPLNFGGAFAPPSKESMKNLRLHLPSSAPGQSYDGSVSAPYYNSDATTVVETSFSHDNYSTDGVEYRPPNGERRPVAMHQHPFPGFGESNQQPPTNLQHYSPNHPPPSHMMPPASPLQYHPQIHPTAFDYQNQFYTAQHAGMPSNPTLRTPSASPYPSSVSPYPSDFSGSQFHCHPVPPQLYAQIQGQHPPPTPPPPHQNFVPIRWQPQMPMQYDTNVVQREGAWHNNHITEFRYGPTPQMTDGSSRLGVSSTTPKPRFSDREVPSDFDTQHFSSNYQRFNNRSEQPPFALHPQIMHSQEHMLHPQHSRPRGRSVDSLSPANMPSGRGRMQTWDSGQDSQTLFKKDNQRHKAAVRRNPKPQHKSKKTNAGTDDQALQRKKKNQPPSPKKKKALIAENTSGIKQKITPSKLKKKEVALESEGITSPPGDPADIKRAELNESPSTRLAFKSFQRNFRIRERSSCQEAEELARQQLDDESLPENIRWRVYLELADLCKRSNRFDEARKLYRQVCELQPYASQGWLEYSKLEEECGHMKKSAEILHAGLKYCEINENLLSRAIKVEEKIGNIGKARQLLARLKHEGIEKVWRSVLEGALLEARAGNDVMSRRVLKYLMHHIPWYGPLYLEAFKLERDLGHSLDALAIVERGLKAIPSYGPLWFGAFRICEILELSEKAFDMPRTLAMVERATASISRELVWKVHLECAQILERAAIESISGKSGSSLNQCLTSCRQRFALTALMCPSNLRWKVWLAGGRMELSAGNTETARMLFRRAYDVVPDKGRALTLLECARLEEFAGDNEAARAILCRARSEFGSDWKVWLESVLLEVRDKKQSRGIELAMMALAVHPGTGRLWATLVQLRILEGEDVQYKTLKLALSAVPKSGEVWCEGARIQLNPYSLTFDLKEAHRRLFFATRFTPQYGDSFVESLRLEVLDKWIVPIATSLWDGLKGPFIDNITAANSDNTRHLIVRCVVDAVRSLVEADADSSLTEATAKALDPDLVLSLRARLEPEACSSDVLDLSDLELRCANADPNYGLLWFTCRRGPSDTARTILSRAREKIIFEISSHAHIYIAAVIRRAGIAAALKVEVERRAATKSSDGTTNTENDDNDVMKEDSEEWHKLLDARLRASPSIDSMLREHNRDDDKIHVKLLEGFMAESFFITGLVESNSFTSLERLSLVDRREFLFGSDSLLS